MRSILYRLHRQDRELKRHAAQAAALDSRIAETTRRLEALDVLDKRSTDEVISNDRPSPSGSSGRDPSGG